jgi:hypothetical protein
MQDLALIVVMLFCASVIFSTIDEMRAERIRQGYVASGRGWAAFEWTVIVIALVSVAALTRLFQSIRR